ncbi:MAG TPA: Uma2 family endonuclease [Pyrinomonadaceae bacterium]|jgi:Uma2 family endonuclease
MSTQPTYHLTPEEYLAIERKAEYKSEYVDGVMYQMAGGSEAHNLITGNVVTELNVQLRDTPCKVYPSDMKVREPGGRKFHYPDVSVVCGETQFADKKKDVILNPVLIVEVLSDSTAAYDRGKKFQSYQQIESLQEYVLIAQDEQVVEKFVRQADGSWRYTKVADMNESIAFSSVNCQLALRDIYAKVI